MASLKDLEFKMPEGLVEVCLACNQRPYATKKQLCRACSMAIWRRMGLGDTWDQALADRRFMLGRRRKVTEPKSHHP